MHAKPQNLMYANPYTPLREVRSGAVQAERPAQTGAGWLAMQAWRSGSHTSRGLSASSLFAARFGKRETRHPNENFDDEAT